MLTYQWNDEALCQFQKVASENNTLSLRRTFLLYTLKRKSNENLHSSVRKNIKQSIIIVVQLICKYILLLDWKKTLELHLQFNLKFIVQYPVKKTLSAKHHMFIPHLKVSVYIELSLFHTCCISIIYIFPKMLTIPYWLLNYLMEESMTFSL